MSEPVSVATRTSPTISSAAEARHNTFRHRRRVHEVLVAWTSLAAAFAMLPLATHGGSAEITSALAIACVAVLAGHGWALPIVVLADALLLPDQLGRIAASGGDGVEPAACGVAVLAMLPGLLAVRRAAAGIVAGFGLERRRARVRIAQLALVATGAIGALAIA